MKKYLAFCLFILLSFVLLFNEGWCGPVGGGPIGGGVGVPLSTIDTEAELEAIWGENIIIETEIDSEAKLEALLGAIDVIVGTEIGSKVQAYDADLAYLAGFTPSADVKTVLNAPNNAAIKVALGYYTAITDLDANVDATEYSYLNGVTSAIQTQLDASCLEAVFGTAIGAGLVLDTGTLKASTGLQSLSGLALTAGDIAVATGANAWNVLDSGTDGYMLVAAGAANPAWTLPTGTGAPVKADSPTFTTKITTPEVENAAALTLDSTGAGVNITTHTDATDDFTVNATMMVIEGDSGNIGFGTATPGRRMEIFATAPYLRLKDSDGAGVASNGRIELYDSNGVNQWWFGNGSTANDDFNITHAVADGNILMIVQPGTGGVSIHVGSVAHLPDRLLHVESDDAVTNTTTQALRLSHTSTGAPVAGIGVGMEFEVETAAGAPGNMEVIATIEGKTSDVTGASEDGYLVFKTMNAGAPAVEAFRIQNQTVVYASETVTCVTNAGTADSLKTISMLVTDAGADNNEDTVALADGILTGQLNIFIFKTDTDGADTVNVTPNAGAGFTDILFAVPGQGCTMIWDGAGWAIVANNGGVVT